MSIEERLKSMGITIPEPTVPMANYVPASEVSLDSERRLVFVSGQVPKDKEGNLIVGKVGQDLSEEDGIKAARLAGLSILSVLKVHLGDLGRIRRVVKLFGMVNSSPEFTNHPAVINGCSNLMVEVFEDLGKHSRSAVGVAALPANVAVEVEGIFEAN